MNTFDINDIANNIAGRSKRLKFAYDKFNRESGFLTRKMTDSEKEELRYALKKLNNVGLDGVCVCSKVVAEWCEKSNLFVDVLFSNGRPVYYVSTFSFPPSARR